MPQDPLQNLASVINTAVEAHGVRTLMDLVSNQTIKKFYDYYEPLVKQNMETEKKTETIKARNNIKTRKTR